MGELITAVKARANSENFIQVLVSEHAQSMLRIINEKIEQASTTTDKRSVYVPFFGTMKNHEANIYRELEAVLVKQAGYSVEYKPNKDSYDYPAITINGIIGSVKINYDN